MLLTVITPAYNEAENLPALYQRLAAVFAAQGTAWEWIVVDDHSRDETAAVVDRLAAADSRVRGVRLARNHGSHAAILYGLDRAHGDAAVVLAGDLQDPPETVPDLLARWRDGAQVVWAVRRTRPGESARTVGFARLYYWIMRRIVGLTQMPATGADFFLIDRRVIEALMQFGERHVSLFALLSWVGFRQDTIDYDKQPRAAGQSGWSLRKKIDLVSDSVTAFSDAPLRAGAAAGALLLAIAAVLLLLAFTGRGAGSLSPGWLLLAASIFAVGGLNLLMLGVIGEYLWRALDETRRRPRWIVERPLGREAATTVPAVPSKSGQTAVE